MKQPTCFGCGVTVPDSPGTYYCDACVKEQMADAIREREAFDAYHSFADSVGYRHPSKD